MNIYDDIEEDYTLDQEVKQAEITAREYINDFLNEIKTVDKEMMKTTAVSFKRKIPFKVKVRRFFNKLGNTLG